MNKENEKRFLINDDLDNQKLLEELIRTGKVRDLDVYTGPNAVGVACTKSGRFISYDTIGKNQFGRVEYHSSFNEAVTGAKEKRQLNELDFIQQQVDKQMWKR